MNLPASIPTRTPGKSIALALATREHFDGYVYTAETVARERAASLDRLRAELATYTTARDYWKPTDIPGKPFRDVVAPHAGHTVVSGGTLTRIDVDKKIRVLRLCITDALADIKHFNGQSIAARTAAALFRNGDPSEMTYSEAVARASQSVDRTPIVNVAAPQVDVHMPERRPQSITATKLPDGSLQATVREAAA